MSKSEPNSPLLRESVQIALDGRASSNYSHLSPKKEFLPATIYIGNYPKEWSFHPETIICPFCHNKVVTELVYKRGTMSLLGCCGLLSIGCIPCCILPLIMKSCKDGYHLCPKCSRTVAVVSVL
ncbi:unnamed protein product [Blepharisma stoltei]|uniref:LITAF domain-containing protein n=1 Tax=Blepharisma stoltei TaxID=1481888 RepID=A0AAU9JE07_9CILI|nr:unnamed protein product [Blepharisma stoltei]